MQQGNVSTKREIQKIKNAQIPFQYKTGEQLQEWLWGAWMASKIAALESRGVFSQAFLSFPMEYNGRGNIIILHIGTTKKNILFGDSRVHCSSQKKSEFTTSLLETLLKIPWVGRNQLNLDPTKLLSRIIEYHRIPKLNCGATAKKNRSLNISGGRIKMSTTRFPAQSPENKFNCGVQHGRRSRNVSVQI